MNGQNNTDIKRSLDPAGVKSHREAFRTLAKKLGAFYMVRQSWVPTATDVKAGISEDMRYAVYLQDGAAALFLMYSGSGREADILEEARAHMVEKAGGSDDGFAAADVMEAIRDVYGAYGLTDLLPPWMRTEFRSGDHIQIPGEGKAQA